MAIISSAPPRLYRRGEGEGHWNLFALLIGSAKHPRGDARDSARSSDLKAVDLICSGAPISEIILADYFFEDLGFDKFRALLGNATAAEFGG